VIFYPRINATELTAYQDLYARGEYKICIAELKKALRRSPNWHEARELQIQAQLATDLPLPALENLLYLLEEDHTTQFEVAVLNMLLPNDKTLAEALQLLEDKLSLQPDFNKARVFLINLYIGSSRASDALPHLAQLFKRQDRSLNLEKKVARICDLTQGMDILSQMLDDDALTPFAWDMKLRLALEQIEYDLALIIFTELLDMNLSLQDRTLSPQFWNLAINQGLVSALRMALELGRQDWVEDVLHRTEWAGDKELAQLPGLLELLPKEPRLLLVKAFNSENPRDGLDILLELENSDYDPVNPGEYGERKSRLLKFSGTFETRYLAYIPTDIILAMAVDNPAHSLALAGWLEENIGGLALEIDMLRQTILYKGVEPKLIWWGFYDYDFDGHLSTGLVLSPDGKWLTSTSSFETWFVNLKTGEKQLYPIIAGSSSGGLGEWIWSPDSKQAAAIEISANLNLVYIYNPNAKEMLQDISLPNNLIKPKILGWGLDSTLLLTTTAGDDQVIKIVHLDTKTGIVWEDVSRQGWPTLTSSNKLAWVRLEEGQLFIDDGKCEMAFQTESKSSSMTPLEWIPGDSKLLLQLPMTSTTATILDLDTGKFSPIELPLSYRPGNWGDGNSAWGIFSISPSSDYKALITVNIETEKYTYAGGKIYSEYRDSEILFCSQGKLLAIATENGVKVYRMP